MSVPEHDPLADFPWREPQAPRAEVSQCIRRQCTGGLCARRGLSAGQRVGLSIGLSAVVVTLIAVMTAGHEHHAGAWHAALIGALGWGVVMLAVLLVGLARPAGRRVSRVVRVGAAMALPLAFLAYLTVTSSGTLPLGEFVHAGGAGGALRCGGYALLFGGLATAAMLFIWRGTDPWSPGLSGALAGLVGGLTGAVAVGCACPTGSTWHLWLGHGAVVLLLLITGALAGRRWLAP